MQSIKREKNLRFSFERKIIEVDHANCGPIGYEVCGLAIDSTGHGPDHGIRGPAIHGFSFLSFVWVCVCERERERERDQIVNMCLYVVLFFVFFFFFG